MYWICILSKYNLIDNVINGENIIFKLACKEVFLDYCIAGLQNFGNKPWCGRSTLKSEHNWPGYSLLATSVCTDCFRDSLLCSCPHSKAARVSCFHNLPCIYYHQNWCPLDELRFKYRRFYLRVVECSCRGREIDGLSRSQLQSYITLWLNIVSSNLAGSLLLGFLIGVVKNL